MAPRHGLLLFIRSLFQPSCSHSVPPFLCVHCASPFLTLLFAVSLFLCHFSPPVCQSPPLLIPPSSLVFSPYLPPLPIIPTSPFSPFFCTSLIFIPPIQLLFITSSLLCLDYLFLFRISLLPFHHFTSIPLFISSSFSPTFASCFLIGFSSALICRSSRVLFPPSVCHIFSETSHFTDYVVGLFYTLHTQTLTTRQDPPTLRTMIQDLCPMQTGGQPPVLTTKAILDMLINLPSLYWPAGGDYYVFKKDVWLVDLSFSKHESLVSVSRLKSPSQQHGAHFVIDYTIVRSVRRSFALQICSPLFTGLTILVISDRKPR